FRRRLRRRPTAAGRILRRRRGPALGGRRGRGEGIGGVGRGGGGRPGGGRGRTGRRRHRRILRARRRHGLRRGRGRALRRGGGRRLARVAGLVSSTRLRRAEQQPDQRRRPGEGAEAQERRRGRAAR